MSSVSSRDRVTQMISGDPFRILLRFGTPLILANTLQQVYAMVDTVILGRYTGVQGLAALGTSSWPIWLSVSFLSNFSQAGSLLVSRRFGAGKTDEMKQAIGNIYGLAGILGTVLTVCFLLLTRPVLLLQNTPHEVFGDAEKYLFISFGGIFLLLGYNVFSSLLRAVGDSRTPLIAIVAATVVNIVLDALFVARLRLGAPGAAIATVIAQGASAIVCFVRVRSYRMLSIRKQHFRFSSSIIREFFSLSIPMLLQSFVIAAGGFFVQTHVNGYGAIFAAGMSATGKVFGLLETAAIALAQAAATFVSQNYGAGLFLRIRQGVRSALALSMVFALTLAGAMFVYGKMLLGLFVAPEAMQTAWELLMVMSVGLLIMYPMYTLRQGIQALGNAMVPLLAAVIQLAARILVTLYLPLVIGRAGMYFTTVTAWITSLILIGIVFPGWLRRCERQRVKAGGRHEE